MVRHAGASKLKLFVSNIFLCGFGAAVFAGDSTSISDPSLNVNFVTPRSSCSIQGEEGVSVSGKVMLCQGSLWTYQGVSEIERIFQSQPIKASDIGTYKTMTLACPAGKRALDGGCALLSGTNYNEAQTLFIDTVTTDLTGWVCGYGPLNAHATDQFYFFGWANAAMSAELFCGVY